MKSTGMNVRAAEPAGGRAIWIFPFMRSPIAGNVFGVNNAETHVRREPLAAWEQ